MNHDVEKKETCSSCNCGGGTCRSGPAKWTWLVLAIAVVGVLLAKNMIKKNTDPSPAVGGTPVAVAANARPTEASEPTTPTKPLPRLVDLGAGACGPCKMMTPILETLKKTHMGKMDVVFIDVWENPDDAKPYAIKVIPTQIFYDADGKERFRHEGFFSKDDILAKWKELGIDLSGSAE